MNGLPSIIIGLFIFGLLVDHQQQSGFAGSVALAIIMLPLIARGSQEVLLLVPGSLREAADALGVSRWRTVLGVILPSALGGIVTSTVLAVARAAGETAPLIFASSVFDPATKSAFNPFEALPNVPVTIFQLSEEGNPEGFTQAWGLSLVLVSLHPLRQPRRAGAARPQPKEDGLMSSVDAAERSRAGPAAARGFGSRASRRSSPAPLTPTAIGSVGAGGGLRRSATSPSSTAGKKALTGVSLRIRAARSPP